MGLVTKVDLLPFSEIQLLHLSFIQSMFRKGLINARHLAKHYAD